MIYAVELDLTDRARRREWDAWYLAHMHKLLRVPGISSAQRFESVAPTPSPFLALYSVTSGNVLQGPDYRSVGGPASTGEWRALHANWHRNVFSGLREAPYVGADQHLVVLDRMDDAAPPLPAEADVLRSDSLDRSVAERGLRVIASGAPDPTAAAGIAMRRFRPLTDRLIAID